MARAIKEGLDYFPLDVDFYDDPKIIFVEEQFGVKGGYIANRLLCWIFRNGYFLTWDEDMALVFAKRVGNGVTHTLVNNVVEALLKRGFFDKRIFDSCSILTSRGIQKRWLKIIQDSKRKADINSCYDCISSEKKGINAPIPPLQTAFLPEETPGETELMQQRKVKESKGKKRRFLKGGKNKKIVRVRVRTKEKKINAPPQPPRGFFPGTPELDMPLPGIKVGVQIERIRYQQKVDITAEQVLGMWEVFKKEYFTGKKNYRDEQAMYQHFGNWLKGQMFSNGQQAAKQGNTSNYGQSAGAIKLAHSLTADLGYTNARGEESAKP